MDETTKCDTKDIPKTKMTRLLIIKNVIVLCAGALILFTAYDGLTMLQSTMNREQGIGVASQAIVYAGFCISSLLFPKYVITKLGSKRTFVLSMLTYIPYIASNFYPHWVLMIPASILIGLGASLLWGSQANYLNDIAVMYASITLNSEKKSNISVIETEVKYKQETESESLNKNNLFSGLCYCASNSRKTELQYDTIKSDNSFCYSSDCQKSRLETDHFGSSNSIHDSLPGNLQIKCDSPDRHNDITLKISYGNGTDCVQYQKTNPDSNRCASIDDDIQLRSKVIESTTARIFGFHGMAYLSCHVWSNLMSYYVLKTDITDTFSNSSCVCGADFCNVESECFVNNLETPSENIRYILTGSCTCLGLLSVLIVALFLDPLETEKKKVSFTLKLMMATYKIAKRKELLLLIPASSYIGMVQGFYTGDFTKSYIGCAWGTYHVGLVTVCYGLACGIASTIAGWLVKQLGRITIFTSAAVVNVAANLFLLFWVPDREETQMFFIAAALWGAHVGVVWSQLRALYGMLFKADEEAAFAAFHMWYSLGFCLSFGYSNYLCTFVKIYILLIVSSLGFIGYLYVEKMQRIKFKK